MLFNAECEKSGMIRVTEMKAAVCFQSIINWLQSGKPIYFH